VTIVVPGVNDAPDAEDGSETTTQKESVSENVIEPDDSDSDGDDLTVREVNGQPLDSDDELHFGAYPEDGILAGYFELTEEFRNLFA
jgi:hypothetical protein